jgi:CDP-4-dehydro-6-deoxyglucose reductase, E1
MVTNFDASFLAHLDKYLKDGLQHSRRSRPYIYPLAEPSYGREEVLQALDSLVSYRTTMWEKVEDFESKFGQLFDSEAVMVNSGSSADLLMCFALMEISGGELPEKSEVLIPAVTWPTHLWSALMAGFKVKLIDVDPNTLCVTPEILKKNISENTRMFFDVHLLGNSNNMDEISGICRESNIVLLEDCCESLGTRWNGKLVGSYGLASSFSFFFSHHLFTMEGGMIVTKDSSFAKRLRRLRAHGWDKPQRPSEAIPLMPEDRYRFISWGFNVRPTELQAGFGLVQLQRLRGFLHRRSEIAKQLCQVIDKFPKHVRTMTVASELECSWFAFPILLNPGANFSRSEFMSFLELNGIETRPIVAGNLARQPAYEIFDNLTCGDLVGADEIHTNGLYIGINPISDEATVNQVCKTITDFLVKQT